MHFLSPPIALIGLLTLAGCASRPDIIAERLAATPVENRAYILGTYVVSCQPRENDCRQGFNSISLYYRADDGNGVSKRINSTTGSMFGNDTNHDFVDQEKKEKGSHFCIPLPPGSYAFHTFEFYNFAGGGSGYSVRENHQFKLPFSLAAGEVAYVGRLKLTSTTEVRTFGFDRVSPGILLLSGDELEVQQASLQKCPEGVRTKPIRNALLNPGMANGNPLVQADTGR